MTGGRFGQIGYIGERLHLWRTQKGLSPQDVCSGVTASTGRELTPIRLQWYELGRLLPDLETAATLARIFDRDTVRLLVPETVAGPPREALTIHALPELRATLRRQGADERHAERFRRLGVNAGLLRMWSKSVPVEQALEYLSIGMDRSSAQQWHRRGVTARAAIVLASSGYEPGTGDASTVDDDADLGLLLVRALRKRIGLPALDLSHLSHGSFDQLASIPWELADFSPAAAVPWFEEGFTPVKAYHARIAFDPAEAAVWARTRIPLGSWEAWRSAGWSADDAGRLAEAGFSPEASVPWRETGLGSSEIVMLNAADFTPGRVRSWQGLGVAPRTMRHWERHGLTPEHHRRWSSVLDRPEQVATWVHERIELDVARSWILAGIRTARQRQRWMSHGFDVTGAAAWAFTGPEHARALINRGISPEQARVRHAGGTEALRQARSLLANRSMGDRLPQTTPPPGNHDDDEDPVSPFRATALVVDVCGACRQPIRDELWCGC